MIFVSMLGRTKGGCDHLSRVLLLVAAAFLALPTTGRALPARLVLALDGVAYRDMKALQAGVTCTNFGGRKFQRHAFAAEEGYFPVSRLVSTFPSASDVAWTDIFGDHPLPGYQRTYYSVAANSEISINGVTTTMEHEHQMNFQVQNGFRRAMGYLFPGHTYDYELHGLLEDFSRTTTEGGTFYAYMRASDDAQHLDRDIFALLCKLDTKLQNLRAFYRARTGHDLQIVILSDHGHNHAGRGKRVPVRAFLEAAGYRVNKTIASPKDVVLPIVGIESWVEVHNAPAETETLAQRLCHLEGVDVLAAIIPDQPDRFLVMNAKSERAVIDWNPEKNSFRYSVQNGDPLNYRPVVEALAQGGQLDAGGFATADAWMAATVTNHYPLALERIVRGLTRGALNPATILISLDNRYVNDVWATHQGSRLVTCGSTHGGLDDICSDGILLSNFASTRDTSTARVAGQFENFPGVRNYRAVEAGAELFTKKEIALTRIPHEPLDRHIQVLPGAGVYLRIWSPQLAALAGKVPIAAAVEKIPRFSTSPSPQKMVFDQPLSFPESESSASERVYALSADLKLEPLSQYRFTGWIQDAAHAERLFDFSFYTGLDGQPAAF